MVQINSNPGAACPAVRTSVTHPLQIGFVDVPPSGGRVGITFCPGKWQQEARTGSWRRDLQADIAVIVAHGASTLVTLIESHEFAELRVPTLGEVVKQSG